MNLLRQLSLLLPGVLLATSSLGEERPHAHDLNLVGDINLGRLVRTEYELRHISPWRKVRPSFPRANIQIGNLEGGVEQAGRACIRPEEYCFRFSPEQLRLLSDAGFTNVGLANNHARDQGVPGLLDTMAELDRAGLTGGILSESPYFVSSNGIRYGLIFINRIASEHSAADDFPSPRLAQALDLAKTNADWVIAYIHWGNELAPWANGSQRDEAKWLIRHGADMVVGSHPHVVQPVDCVEGHPVWFSLGNHVFDQKYPSTHSGGLITCDGADSLSCKGYRTTRGENSAVLQGITADATLDTPGECTPHKKLKPPLQLNGIELSLSDTRELESSSVLDLNIGDAKEYGLRNLPVRRIAKYRIAGGEHALFLLLDLYSDIDSVKGVRPHVYRVSQNGIQPLWRGSGLAYPLIDAVPVPNGKLDALCALHARGSFLTGVQADQPPFVMAYQWNGFGFSAERSDNILHKCRAIFEDSLNRSSQPEPHSSPLTVLDKKPVNQDGVRASAPSSGRIPRDPAAWSPAIR